ncbi:MAG TPA: hypothetical protein VFJ84_01060 [Candidatus Saccharimonadales bacterium]|nr:hypothetical protein [Candidatus Saccharimonadales bacterium]
MLEEIIERAIELIESDARQEGDVYPPMAHTAAKRVLAQYNFTTRLNVERIWFEAATYDFEHRVIDDSYRFICTSLPDIIGAFVKHRMGDRYQHLFDERMAEWSGAAVE